MTNFNDNNRKDDMSMEDILASIRKYVADDDNKQPEDRIVSEKHTHEDFPKNETVIKLSESQIVDHEKSPQNQSETRLQTNVNESPATYSEVSSLSMNTMDASPEKLSSKESPFNKLANALDTYGKSKSENNKDSAGSALTVDKFLESLATPIIEKWVENNIPRIVEKAVDREIQKLKNN